MSGRVFSFDKFALQPKASTTAKVSTTSSSSSSNVPQKRVIQCSDDEYESEIEIVVEAKKTATSDTDDGWEESRNGDKMSSQEKAVNIKRGQQERSLAKIGKRSREADFDDDDDAASSSNEIELEPFRKIDYSTKGSSALDNSLLEDTPEPRVKAKENNIYREDALKKERDNRVDKRSTAQSIFDLNESAEKKSSKISLSDGEKDVEEAEAGDTDDSDDDDDDDNDESRRGWNDESEIQEKAQSVLRYCETIGKTLRENLESWGGGDSKVEDSSDTAKPTKSSFCTGLMSIKQRKGDNNTDKTDILSDEYFKDVCPGLILKGYQLVGVNWLKLLHENNINGVLADDMGLGKTVQSIAFLGWLKTSRQADPDNRSAHLIVVPASTLSNWENELKKFCPLLNVVSYHGTQNERAELRHDLRRDIKAGRVDVLLSTFTIFERESGKDDRSFIYKQNFEYLIVDEAHCLKVSSSARFTNMNAIRAGHRLLLSGTPVQNDLGELLSLMSFTMPKLFRNINIDELLEGFGWDKKSGVPSSSSSSVSINQLRGMLAPFVLRRVKSDVLDQLVEKV